jgi:hypothetical protein
MLRRADWQNPEAKLFALDDAIEEMEWGSINMGVRSMVHARTIALRLLHEVITPACQV